VHGIASNLSRNGNNNGREMDFPTRSAEERAAQYDREAQKFLKMAEAETVARIRAQLAALAEQYHELALSLRSARKIGR
jgi:hypothetical protein